MFNKQMGSQALKMDESCRFIKISALLGGVFLALSLLAKKTEEPESIDRKNPYLKKQDASMDRIEKGSNLYAGYIKRMLDKAAAFLGIIFLAPLCAAISLAIYLDEPGPVLFTQKRVGEDGHFIRVHKFRSMKLCAPHDVPTHKLENPGEYITKIGKILRESSLDELPQIWDIFRGKMSVVGPRPALWNQDDLIAEREKYGANSVRPGLTGWAQVNGRDKLGIPKKAALDGEYAKKLRTGGKEAFFQDIRCLAYTVKSVMEKDGIVEGRAGDERA